MTSPNSELSTVDDLVSRCREIAKKAPRHRPGPEVLERITPHERGVSLFPPVATHKSENETGPGFAGSFAETMFDLAGYGGRLCEDCHESIDQKRGGSRFCSDSCRAKSWRNDKRSYRNPHR